jgi:ubiquinone/menaquinone biosynthesis C-methylase UbiE
MLTQLKIKEKLEKIKLVFNIRDILKKEINQEYIKKYYNTNKIPYSIFHTKKDLLHMGISKDGKYKEEDLLEAAKTVEKFLKKSSKKVLELGTGRGANSIYLAKKYLNIDFYGIDTSKGQLSYAFKRASKINNFHPEFGDYHNLKKFDSASFDIVFVIEALCHSTKKTEVLNQVYRILRNKGIFIIFDGYQNKNNLLENERIALKLTEIGMAVEKFESYESFINKVKKNKFKIILEEDASNYVLPTMNQFERIAKIFFSHPILARFISTITPKAFTYNSLSGYLMPDLIKDKIACYMITILKK